MHIIDQCGPHRFLQGSGKQERERCSALRRVRSVMGTLENWGVRGTPKEAAPANYCHLRIWDDEATTTGFSKKYKSLHVCVLAIN